MKHLLLITTMMIILASCTTDRTTETKEEQVPSQVVEVGLDRTNTSKLTDPAEDKLQAWVEEVERLEEELAQVTQDYEALQERLEDQEGKNGVTWTPLKDMDIKTYSGGGKVLEDGIFYVMEAYDKDGVLAWIKVWDKIEVATLDTWSEMTLTEAIIYLVVDGSLYGLDTYTGDVIVTADHVGQSSQPPYVYANGDIVTIGQFQPYVTYINSKGDILWQKDQEDFIGTWAMDLTAKTIEVTCDQGKILLDRQGQVLLNQEDVQKLYEEAVELYSWFDVGMMPTDSETKVQINGRWYYKVTGPFTYYNEFVQVLQSVFDEGTVEDLLARKAYMNVDGDLYSVPADRGTDIGIGEDIAYDIERQNDHTYIYKVEAENLNQEGQVEGSTTYNYTLERFEDGQWRFVDFYLFR